MKIGLELRVQVFQRSWSRCEYCLIHAADASLSHEVDHIVSRQHGGATVLANLACACWLCNRFKGTNLTSVDSLGSVVRLYDPRTDLWKAHFGLKPP